LLTTGLLRVCLPTTQFQHIANNSVLADTKLHLYHTCLFEAPAIWVAHL
jgi:hypothetical protein